MHLNEYRSHDMTGLAALLAAGQISAEVLHDTASAAIEEVDAELNAVADRPWKSPLAFAERGPFAGVPFVVKDLFNVTGTPAISLPLGATDDGLPTGVQLAADMCREPTLLRLVARLEAVLPWRGRLPPVHPGHRGR